MESVELGTAIKLKAGDYFRDEKNNRYNVGPSCRWPAQGKWMPADKGRVVYYCTRCEDFEEEPIH